MGAMEPDVMVRIHLTRLNINKLDLIYKRQ